METAKQIHRGEIYFANLPEGNAGSVQAGRRPVLITQNDFINERAPTVLVATVTSVLKRLDLKTHVLLPKLGGLAKRSMVMAEQRYTLDKNDLGEYCCTLPDHIMQEIDRAIRHAERGGYTRRSIYRRHNRHQK